MRGLTFVNGDEDDTIRFLLSFVDGDYDTEKLFREVFREQLEIKKVHVDDVEGTIDQVINKMDSKPWEY